MTNAASDSTQGTLLTRTVKAVGQDQLHTMHAVTVLEFSLLQAFFMCPGGSLVARRGLCPALPSTQLASVLWRSFGRPLGSRFSQPQGWTWVVADEWAVFPKRNCTKPSGLLSCEDSCFRVGEGCVQQLSPREGKGACKFWLFPSHCMHVFPFCRRT